MDTPKNTPSAHVSIRRAVDRLAEKAVDAVENGDLSRAQEALRALREAAEIQKLLGH